MIKRYYLLNIRFQFLFAILAGAGHELSHLPIGVECTNQCSGGDQSEYCGTRTATGTSQ